MPRPTRAAAQKCKELLDTFDLTTGISSDSDDEPLWTFQRRHQDVRVEEEEDAIEPHFSDSPPVSPSYSPTAPSYYQPDTPSDARVTGSPSDSPTAQRRTQSRREDSFVWNDGEEYVRTNPDHPGSPRWQRRRDGVDFYARLDHPANWPSYSPTEPSYSPTSPMSRDDTSASPSYSPASPGMPMSPSYALPPYMPDDIVPPQPGRLPNPSEELGGEWVMTDGMWRMVHTEDDRVIQSVQLILAGQGHPHPQRTNRDECSSSGGGDLLHDQLVKIQCKNRIADYDTPEHEHCVICAGANIRTVAFVPCGHVPCCGACALSTYDALPYYKKKLKCPLCSTKVEMAYFAHI